MKIKLPGSTRSRFWWQFLSIIIVVLIMVRVVVFLFENGYENSIFTSVLAIVCWAAGIPTAWGLFVLYPRATKSWKLAQAKYPKVKQAITLNKQKKKMPRKFMPALWFEGQHYFILANNDWGLPLPDVTPRQYIGSDHLLINQNGEIQNDVSLFTTIFDAYMFVAYLSMQVGLDTIEQILSIQQKQKLRLAALYKLELCVNEEACENDVLIAQYNSVIAPLKSMLIASIAMIDAVEAKVYGAREQLEWDVKTLHKALDEHEKQRAIVNAQLLELKILFGVIKSENKPPLRVEINKQSSNTAIKEVLRIAQFYARKGQPEDVNYRLEIFTPDPVTIERWEQYTLKRMRMEIK